MKIHQIGGYGEDSNVYLIIDKIIALVDAGTGRHFDMVTKNLQKFGISPSDIELIIWANKYDEINRRLTAEEFSKALEIAEEAGLKNVIS